MQTDKAFKLAIEIASRDPAQRRRFEGRLAEGEPISEVGISAAYHCQIKALGLMPWQTPPCFADMTALKQPLGDPRAARESADLALRLDRCGVSRWHPDPANECDRVEAAQRNPAKRG